MLYLAEVTDTTEREQLLNHCDADRYEIMHVPVFTEAGVGLGLGLVHKHKLCA